MRKSRMGLCALAAGLALLPACRKSGQDLAPTGRPIEAPPAPTASAQPANAAFPQPNRAVSVGDPVPDFTLTDQTGAKVRLSQYRGQPVGVTFLYTTCPDVNACPMTAAKFSRLDAMLREKRFGHLLVVTVDPEHDTPVVLKQYAEKVGADPKRWSFLTGEPAAVAEAAARFGVLYSKKAGQLIHQQGVAVVDPDGKLATIYYGANWEPEHLLRDMTRTLHE
jgi:protein SCO1/2